MLDAGARGRMKPNATIRVRRLTALVAVAWALLSLVLALTPFARTTPTLGLPFVPSGAASVVVVQEPSLVAAALGVEPADQVETIDGRSIHEWFAGDLAGLKEGVSNVYGLRKRDGRTYEVRLAPEWWPPLWQRPWSAMLRAALIVVSCLYLACGLLVWRLRPDRAESWALLLFCCTMSTSLASGQETEVATWSHLRMFVNLPFIGATIFHLFTTYPVEPLWIVRRRGLRAVPYAGAAAIALLVALTPTLGLPPALMPAIGFYWTIGISVFCLATLAYERRRLRRGRATDRADVMLLGALVAFAPVITVMIGQAYFQTALPWYVAMLWFLIFPVAVGYGIVRRQLFEIRVVAKSSAAYGAATLAITGVFAFLITFADATVRRFNVNPGGTWFSLAFLFFAILVFNPLRNRLQQLVDRVFDRDRAAYRLAVREISEAMVSMLSLKEIGDRILVALTDTMGVERAMVMLLDEEQRVLEPSASRGDWDRESLQSEIPADHPIVTYFLARRSLSRLDFDDENDPEVREACRDVFDTLEVELLVPIVYGLELLGVIAVGRKLSGDRFVVEDRQLLRTLANQSAIAIENAKAYDEIAELNSTLEARVEQRTRELGDAQAQLVQSEKMASLGQLVAGVAHELNNPIGFVHANLQLLEEQTRKIAEAAPGSPEAQRAREAMQKLLARSREGTARVKKIVEDLRTFSRVDQAELQEIDLHDGIERTLSLMEPRLKDGITVVKQYGDLPPVRCYAGQLNQVFMNLLMNACDAMPGGGTITIRTARADHGVRLDFSDTGPGIPPEIRSRIFDPFFTTKAVGKGTGLGLSISHGIVERHGGRIGVESAMGEGTTFSIELPLDAAPGTA